MNIFKTSDIEPSQRCSHNTLVKYYRQNIFSIAGNYLDDLKNLQICVLNDPGYAPDFQLVVIKNDPARPKINPDEFLKSVHHEAQKVLYYTFADADDGRIKVFH